MNNLFISAKLALVDFWNNLLLLSVLCSGLALIMFGLSFSLNLILNYEMNRIPALNKYTDNNLVKITVDDTNYIEDNIRTKDYILRFISENEDIVMASVEGFDIINSYTGYAVIGIGKFNEFYGIIDKGINKLNYTYFGSNDKNLGTQTQYNFIESSLPYISTSGRYLVVLLNEMVITGNIQLLLDNGIDGVSSVDLMKNFIFINANQATIDQFINEINSIDDSFYVFQEDLNKSLIAEVNKGLLKLTTLTAITLMMLVILLISIIKITCYICDKNIKMYTINLLFGTQLKYIGYRIFFLEMIIISISTILALLVIFFLNGNSLIKYVLIQSVVYLIIFPIYPILRLKRLELYDNLRGEFNE